MSSDRIDFESRRLMFDKLGSDRANGSELESNISSASLFSDDIDPNGLRTIFIDKYLSITFCS